MDRRPFQIRRAEAAHSSNGDREPRLSILKTGSDLGLGGPTNLVILIDTFLVVTEDTNKMNSEAHFKCSVIMPRLQSVLQI